MTAIYVWAISAATVGAIAGLVTGIWLGQRVERGIWNHWLFDDSPERVFKKHLNEVRAAQGQQPIEWKEEGV